ncbi:hypothetical protein N0V94_003037 [Neodidymelliopsis sp. IMI 364377]|nr:hypothetical protein N0V94_003037 [Neodidymelliopsis sp. IMI 364377]
MTADARAGALGQARAAEATAHTLNYALGTRHKKSWMAAPPAEPAGLSGHAGLNPLQFQPRKRGRPPKVRTPNMEEQQHATEAANATNAPPAERLPSSNSTSPQLANIVTNHPQDRSQSRANVIVLPSPTPSEEDEHRATVPTSRPNNEVVNSAQRRRQLEEEAIRAFLQAMNPSGSHLSSRTLSDPFEAETQLYAGRGAFNYVTEKFQAALEGQGPVLKIRNIASPVFYFWQGFVSKPAKLVDANNAIEKVSFKLSDKEIKFVSTALPTARGAPAERLIDEDRKVIRLRCVKWPSDQPVTDEAWAVSAHSWIPHAFFTFNGTPLELRKKLHNGKDLPSDLTELVREGQNVLEVTIMSDSDDITHRDYYVAIEFLGIMTREAIQETCRTNRIPAQETLNAIKRKLSVGIADDDDIAIVETTLTVNLRDPFSATKICDVPVRSTACLHNECFDLDTFLDTRPSKGNVSTADQWRCPICKADARPCQLVIDDFLVGVRNELEKNNLLDTRAIIVDQNGAWTPKPEERDPNGVQDCDTPDPISEIPAFHEIIDLDSD